MSYAKFIDEQIRKAIEAGEFDNLEGKGQPIDLASYFAVPEDSRLGYGLLKSNNFVPEEVDRLKEIGELREKVRSCEDLALKERLIKDLREKEMALAMILERNKRKR